MQYKNYTHVSVDIVTETTYELDLDRVRVRLVVTRRNLDDDATVSVTEVWAKVADCDLIDVAPGRHVVGTMGAYDHISVLDGEIRLYVASLLADVFTPLVRAADCRADGSKYNLPSSAPEPDDDEEDEEDEGFRW